MYFKTYYPCHLQSAATERLKFLYFQICTGNSLYCATQVFQQVGVEVNKRMSNASESGKRCLQRCEFQTDSVVLTSTSYPSKTIFPFMEEFCYLWQKILKICIGNKAKQELFDSYYPNFKCANIQKINETYEFCRADFTPNTTLIQQHPEILNFLFEYAQNNIALLNVYIKDPYYTKIKRDEQITNVSFVANIGGLLGLCMGLSIISIFEVLYFGTFFIYNKLLN